MSEFSALYVMPRSAVERRSKRRMFEHKDVRVRRGRRSASIAGQSRQHDVAEAIASSAMALVTFPERKVTPLAAASGTKKTSEMILSIVPIRPTGTFPASGGRE